jgi:hypothetical protein
MQLSEELHISNPCLALDNNEEAGGHCRATSSIDHIGINSNLKAANNLDGQNGARELDAALKQYNHGLDEY